MAKYPFHFIKAARVPLTAYSDTLILIFYAYEAISYTDIKGYQIMYEHYAGLHGYNMEENVEA